MYGCQRRAHSIFQDTLQRYWSQQGAYPTGSACDHRNWSAPGTFEVLGQCWFWHLTTWTQRGEEFIVNWWYRKEEKICVLSVMRPLKPGLRIQVPVICFQKHEIHHFPFKKQTRLSGFSGKFWFWFQILPFTKRLTVRFLKMALNKMCCNKGRDTICSCMKTMLKKKRN